MLLVFGEIQDNIKNHIWKETADEICIADDIDFERLIIDVKEKYSEGFTKKYREMTDSEFVEIVLEQMQWWKFIRRIPENRQIIIYPAVGKMKGSYPESWNHIIQGGEKDE